VQLVVLAVFIGLVAATRWEPGGRSPVEAWFLRLDPLVMLTAAVSPMHRFLPYFVPALVLLGLTVVFGRFFCGWICPLGTTLDAAETLFWRKRKRVVEHANRPALKYYVLAAVVLAAAFGTQIAWLLDPIPLITRATAQAAAPVAQQAYNFAVTAGEPVLRALHVHAYPGEVHTFSLNLAVAAMLAVAIGLSYISRRYWCRTVCPLGALLGMVGRWGLWRRWVTGCLTCNRCVTDCKMGAIPQEHPSRTVSAECILCYNCISCPKAGIVHVSLGREKEGHLTALGTSRRKFLAAAGAGIAYGAVASTGMSRKPLSDKLIRPPGAIERLADGTFERLTEDDLRAACVRCGNCMKVCPTGVIQPAVIEAGLDGFYTPMMVPRMGWCEQSCTACGDVCPSGALAPFTEDEKYALQIGRAWVNQSKCLAWRRGKLFKLCLVCYEHCPYSAVQLNMYEGQKRPAVDEERCVGCGQCENRCPIEPERAITVQRKDWTGPRRAPTAEEVSRRSQEQQERSGAGQG
jgi:polyferredoxin/ferredoxin